jgi:(2Fe-2S) ferredoxin
MSDALVLVGMSAREVQARDRLLGLAAARGASLAFLQLGDPSLSRELTRLADEGVDRIVLVGVSLGTLAPTNGWMRRVAGHWLRERAGRCPEVVTAMSLLGDEGQLDDVLRRTRVVTTMQASLASPAWEEVTRHRHQVLVCRGPRCTALGSDASAEALILALMSHDQNDDDVLITHTGCQLPCTQAPVMSVQPDDVWYGQVDPDAARLIVAEHLVGGRPVDELRLPRHRGGPPSSVEPGSA